MDNEFGSWDVENQLILQVYESKGSSIVNFPRHGLPPPPPPKPNAAAVQYGTIQQQLDHFDPNELRTWTMVGLIHSYPYKQKRFNPLIDSFLKTKKKK